MMNKRSWISRLLGRKPGGEPAAEKPARSARKPTADAEAEKKPARRARRPKAEAAEKAQAPPGATALGDEPLLTERVPPPEAAEVDVPAVWNVSDVILDLYEVQEELGKGGMGIVHKVRHRTWNVDLAVKSPPGGACWRAPGVVDAFVQEAELWGNLPAHPHIVTCHHVRVLGGTPPHLRRVCGGGQPGGKDHQRRAHRPGHDAQFIDTFP